MSSYLCGLIWYFCAPQTFLALSGYDTHQIWFYQPGVINKRLNLVCLVTLTQFDSRMHLLSCITTKIKSALLYAPSILIDSICLTGSSS